MEDLRIQAVGLHSERATWYVDGKEMKERGKPFLLWSLVFNRPFRVGVAWQSYYEEVEVTLKR